MDLAETVAETNHQIISNYQQLPQYICMPNRCMNFDLATGVSVNTVYLYQSDKTHKGSRYMTKH